MNCTTVRVPLAGDLTNLLNSVERLIRFEPNRPRSTQANDGEVDVPIDGCPQNDTCHVPLACAKHLDENASKTQHVSQIETGKLKFDSSFYERNTIRSVALRFVKSDIGTNIWVGSSNPG